MRHALLSLVALLLAPSALACEGVYDTGDLLTDLTTVEAALRGGDGEGAGATATSMESRLACLGEPLPFMIVGRIFRGIGAGKLASGDEARGRQWFLTALEVDPTFDYGTEDLPIGSPIREAYMDLRAEADADPLEVQGSTFGPGRFYLDGSIAGSPRATGGRPHLLQRQADGAVRGWLVEGNAFPADALAAAAVVEAPREDPREARRLAKEEERARRAAEAAAVVEPSGGQQTAGVTRGPEPGGAAQGPAPREPRADRPPRGGTPAAGGVVVKRPPEKTPLMIGGAVALAGAGALYYLSYDARQDFEGARTEAEMSKAARSTNQLFLASAAVLAAGATAFTWGVAVDGGGPQLGLRVRF